MARSYSSVALLSNANIKAAVSNALQLIRERERRSQQQKDRAREQRERRQARTTAFIAYVEANPPAREALQAAVRTANGRGIVAPGLVAAAVKRAYGGIDLPDMPSPTGVQWEDVAKHYAPTLKERERASSDYRTWLHRVEHPERWCSDITEGDRIAAEIVGELRSLRAWDRKLIALGCLRTPVALRCGRSIAPPERPIATGHGKAWHSPVPPRSLLRCDLPRKLVS